MDLNAKIEATAPVVKGKPRAVFAVDGLSAYEIALKHGFEGTEEAWLDSIVRGEPGKTPVLGVDYFNGEDGKDGLSAYEIAKKYGFEGNEEEWLESVVYGADGNDGLSAYEIAKKYNFVGTEAQWLASLKGTDGENGGAICNDEVPFIHDNPQLGISYSIRPENYATVDFSNYKEGNVYSRQWNNADGTRRGTALLKYEGADNGYYAFNLIALINNGEGVLPKLRVDSTTNYWEVSYDNGETWESTEVKATGDKGDKGDKGDEGDKGDTGDEGKSAYDIAKEVRGFEGTEDEWLDYLNGFTKTIMTTDGSVLRIFVGTQEQYQALEDKSNLFALVTDDPAKAQFDDIVKAVAEIQSIQSRVEDLENKSGKLLKYELSEDGNSYICTGHTGNALTNYEDVDLIIPSEYEGLPVRSIADSAFWDTTFKSLTLPSTITSIGRSAFGSNAVMKYAYIPSSVTSVGATAFAANSNLIIYCEATEQPADWSSSWNISSRPVVWGASAPDVGETAYSYHATKADSATTTDKLAEGCDEYTATDGKVTIKARAYRAVVISARGETADSSLETMVVLVDYSTKSSNGYYCFRSLGGTNPNEITFYKPDGSTYTPDTVRVREL